MKEKECIMVVDDDRTNLCMTEEALIEHYDVILALSGAQALDVLQKGKTPDLILLDIDMPHMDGYETFERICEMDALPHIPVVFLTGVTGSDAELTGLELGAQDFIEKPFVRENLIARIRLRLESGRQTRQLQEVKVLLREAGIDEDRFGVFTKKLRHVEKEVARLLALGYNNEEIAVRLGYAIGYVKNIIIAIYDKVGVRNRRELRELLRS